MAARNTICPCGSGKKYKKCCLIKDDGVPGYHEDADWRHLDEAITGFLERINRYVEDRVGTEEIFQAAELFILGKKFAATENPWGDIFVHWLWSRWERDEKDSLVNNYFKSYADQIDDVEKELIGELNHQPFSLFEVTAVVKGKRLFVRDLFLDRMFEVKEAHYSRDARQGDIIYARIVTVKGQSLIRGIMHEEMPQIFRETVLSFKEKNFSSPLTLSQLFASDSLVRHFVWELVEREVDIVFWLIRYQCECSIETVYERLIPLCNGDQKGTELEVEYDGKEMISFRFIWIGEGGIFDPETRMFQCGIIVFDEEELTIVAHLEDLKNKAQSMLQEAFGEDLVLLQSERACNLQLDPDQEEVSHALNDLEADPRFRKFWSEWIDRSHLALNGSTPREMMKEDFEKVIGLFVTDWERYLNGTQAENKDVIVKFEQKNDCLV